jgi:hypothetical protein
MQSQNQSKNVISFAEAKAKRVVKEDLANGRKPLYISHQDGKLKGSPHLKEPSAEDFGDRLTRIKTSLEKINRLMSELRKVSRVESVEANQNTVSITKKPQ